MFVLFLFADVATSSSPVVLRSRSAIEFIPPTKVLDVAVKMLKTEEHICTIPYTLDMDASIMKTCIVNRIVGLTTKGIDLYWPDGSKMGDSDHPKFIAVFRVVHATLQKPIRFLSICIQQTKEILSFRPEDWSVLLYSSNSMKELTELMKINIPHICKRVDVNRARFKESDELIPLDTPLESLMDEHGDISMKF